LTLVTLVSATPGTVIRNVATVTGGGGRGSGSAVLSNGVVLTASVTGSQPSPPPPGSSQAGPPPAGSSQPGPPPPGSAQAGPPPARAGALPQTGRDLGQPAAVALLLLLLGLALRISGRRRSG
jgi:LPXTG-motif cell wall-anchored protein